MATEEYPSCSKRHADAERHPTCNNPAKGYFLRPVRPAECRRCLGLEPMPTDMTTAESLPALPPLPPLSAAPEPPGLVRRAFSYTEALARWTAAGQPERPDKEVERIFHQHCKMCNWFNGERRICRGCGCRVAEGGYAVLNKIKMATEHCPRNLW